MTRDALFAQHWDLARMRANRFWREYGHLVASCEHKDVMQYAAIALLECLAAYRPGNRMTLRSYIWGMVPWRIGDQLRKADLMVRDGRKAMHLVPLEADYPDLAFRPEAEMERRDAARVMRGKICRLDPRQRTVTGALHSFISRSASPLSTVSSAGPPRRMEATLRGETLVEAGKRVGVKFPRASQLRKSAIRVLQERMAA